MNGGGRFLKYPYKTFMYSAVIFLEVKPRYTSESFESFKNLLYSKCAKYPIKS